MIQTTSTARALGHRRRLIAVAVFVGLGLPQVGYSKSIPESGLIRGTIRAQADEAEVELELALESQSVQRSPLLRALRLRLPDLQVFPASSGPQSSEKQTKQQLTISDLSGRPNQVHIELDTAEGERFDTVITISTRDAAEQVARAVASLILSVQREQPQRDAADQTKQGPARSGDTDNGRGSEQDNPKTEASRVAKQTKDPITQNNQASREESSRDPQAGNSDSRKQARLARKQQQAAAREAQRIQRQLQREAKALKRARSKAQRKNPRPRQAANARGLLELSGLGLMMLSTQDFSGRQRSFGGIGPGLRLGLQPRSTVPVHVFAGVDLTRAPSQEVPASLDRLRIAAGVGYQWNWAEHWQLSVRGGIHLELWWVQTNTQSWIRSQRYQNEGPSLGGSVELGVFWRSRVVRRGQAHLRWRVGPELGAGGGALVGSERSAPSIGVETAGPQPLGTAEEERIYYRLSQVGGAELRLRLVAGLSWGRGAKAQRRP